MSELCTTDAGEGTATFGLVPRTVREWLRLLFPSIFLVYTLQTVSGVAAHADGALAVAGYVGVAAFAVIYLVAITALFGGRERVAAVAFVALVAVTAFEVVVGHNEAFAMFIFVGVVVIFGAPRHAPWVCLALVATALFLPPSIPSWHEGIDVSSGFAVAMVLLAMFAFSGVIKANHQLTDARAEIGRLAADNERNRIARDLHDLLGHSLTAITVKAALAGRLADAGEHERAAEEIRAVEHLTRSALVDVRAAVSGFRAVTVAGELATGAEILRAAGIVTELPTDPSVVQPELAELFGWVAREAMTNVVRHASARHCTVTVGPDWIRVSDDGPGAPGVYDPGSGLAGLRERVHAEGCRLVSGPQPFGWVVEVSARHDEPAETPDAPSTVPDGMERAAEVEVERA